jgi:hypothetical protein
MRNGFTKSMWKQFENIQIPVIHIPCVWRKLFVGLAPIVTKKPTSKDCAEIAQNIMMRGVLSSLSIV